MEFGDFNSDVEVSAVTREFITLESGEPATRTTEFDLIAGTEYVILQTYVRSQIHEDMPEFLFVRRIGGIVDFDVEPSFPQLREVSILIYDDMNNLIQYIPNLFQADSSIMQGIVFDDLNFDGYLDMRLMRWQDSAWGLLANEYFWLWDSSSAQFVLNEQLMDIYFIELRACHETRQIGAFNRGDGTFVRFSYYEYRDGEFVLVADERYYFE